MRRIAVLAGFVLITTACSTTASDLGTAATTQAPEAPTTTSTVVPSTTVGAVPVVEDTTPPLITDGVTVTDDTIHIGVLADLSGPFSGNVVDVMDAQLAFWSDLNDRGGIAGRHIEVHVADTGYDLGRHQQSYAELVDDVVMFSHSTGSPHTAAIADDLQRDDRLAIPIGFYSGWSDATLGANILELGSNYCLEATNVLAYLAESHQTNFGTLPKIAIATDSGDYGQDSATGAKHAAEVIGLDVVFDGEATLGFGQDTTQVASQIATSGADYTWLATDPVTTADVVSNALNAGYRGSWAGASPSFSPRLLDTALGDYLAQSWLVSMFFAPIGSDVEGMDDVYRVLEQSFPDRYPSDAFIAGYLEFLVAVQVLERAVEIGDLTPQGVVAASVELGSAELGEFSPPNTFAGEMNEVVARSTALYRPTKSGFEAQGGLSATMADGAVSPFELVQPFFVSDVAADYDLTQPCYVFGPEQPTTESADE